MAEIQYDATINGKAVHFRERLPAKENGTLLQLLADADNKDGDTLIAYLVKVVDRWEFQGSPTDPKAYEDLDLFDELISMSDAAGKYLNQRIARMADIKN